MCLPHTIRRNVIKVPWRNKVTQKTSDGVNEKIKNQSDCRHCQPGWFQSLATATKSHCLCSLWLPHIRTHSALTTPRFAFGHTGLAGVCAFIGVTGLTWGMSSDNPSSLTKLCTRGSRMENRLKKLQRSTQWAESQVITIYGKVWCMTTTVVRAVESDTFCQSGVKSSRHSE